MVNIRFFIFSFFIMILAYPSLLRAESIMLDEVVVTATRGEKDAKTAPGSVTVINQEDIRKKNPQSIDTLLKNVPGFSGRRDVEFSTLTPNVNIRGISGNRTMFMVDGLVINEARTGGGYFDGVPLENIEQVEVVKGPFSSLYGSQGMAGVVNVRTRMPEQREFSVKTGYGSSWHRGEAYDDLFTYHLAFGDKLADKFSFLVSYNRKETNGFAYQKNVSAAKPGASYWGYQNTAASKGTPAYLLGDKGDGKIWNDAITAKVQYEINHDSKFNFSFIRTNNRVNYDDPHTLVKNSANEEVFLKEYSYLATASGRERNIYQASFETVFSEVEMKLSLGLIDQLSAYNRTPGSTTKTTIHGGPGTYLDSPAKTYSADLQFTSPFFSNQKLTWGGSYKYDKADSTTYNLANWKDEYSKTGLNSREGGRAGTISLYLQDEIKFADKLTAYVGGRMDWWKTNEGYYEKGANSTNFKNRSESSFSPKGALVYQPFEETVIKFSGGKAFNAPTLYQLYNKYIGTYTTAANPNLKPEIVWSWDVSLNQGLWDGAELTVGYFENHLDDLIYTKVIDDKNRERTNVGKARSRGFEAAFKQRINDHLTFSTDYTYTDAKIRQHDADPKLEGRRLQDVPQHIWNLSLEGEYGTVSAYLGGRYESKRYGTDDNSDKTSGVYTSYDAAFVADAKVTYNISDSISTSVSVNNLFNRDYYNYYQAPGRSWFVDVAYRY